MFLKKTLTVLVAAVMLQLAGPRMNGYCAGAPGPSGDVPERKEVELTPEECMDIALSNSFEVQLARLDLRIAETDEMYAEAVFDTLIFGNVSYGEDKRQQASVFSGDNAQNNTYYAGVSKELLTGTEVSVSWGDERNWSNSGFISPNPSHNAQLTLEARQPIGKNFMGFADRTELSITRLAIQNADLRTRDRIQEHIAEVEKAYWRLVFSKEVLGMYSDILEKAEKLNDRNEKNFDMGIVEKADLLASQANVMIRRTDLHLARNRYKRAAEELKLLLNLREDLTVIPVRGFSEGRMEYDLAGCLRTAFEKRWDYIAGKRDVEIRGLGLEVKRNQLWPEIDLTASMAINGLEGKFHKAAGKTVVNDNTYYYAGIEVSVPLENNLARGEFDKAGYEKEKALVALKKIEREIITEVGNSFRDVKTYDANTTMIREAVHLQSRKLEEEEKRYGYGRSNTKNLIDYQTDLLRSEIEEATVLLDREMSRVDLEKNMNTLLERYGGRI